jgi:hypothetical protein
VTASGYDIEWDLDQFHYVYQPWTGDGQIIARVVSVQPTDPWSKAGVMFRQNLSQNTRNAHMLITPGNGLAFQRRLTPNAFTQHTTGALVPAPYWVRLVRAGDLFSAYSSPDGVTWTLVGSDTIAMPTTLYVGLSLTSHNNAALCTATFDNVTVGP